MNRPYRRPHAIAIAAVQEARAQRVLLVYRMTGLLAAALGCWLLFPPLSSV